MIHDQLTLKTLQKLGLTYYEAKAYAALMSTGVSNPSLIAEESGIPRTKIYGALKKLAADNWITMEKGRPTIVTPRYPGEIIEEQKSLFNSDVDRVSNELSMTYDSMLKNEIPQVRIIHCLDTIIQLTAELMSGAKKKIMLMGSLYFTEELEIIKDQIIKAKDRGISIRIITTPSAKLNNTHIINQLSEVTKDIKLGHPYSLKSMIVDDRDTLLMIARVQEDVPDLENVIAIFISNVSLASYFSSVFDMDWKNLKYIK
ncbi:MAG TPA: helix-turn-helix domain-containing protein [Methanobacterium sp.]